jgi:hypothetical protein
MKLHALLFGLALALSSCGIDEKQCIGDKWCVVDGVAGRCLDDKMGHNWCVEIFDGCPTRYRWRDDASPSLALKCVRPEYFSMDGGVDGAATD